MIIVSNTLSDQPNDRNELLPVLDAAESNNFKVEKVLADTGYYSEKNVEATEDRNIEPIIAVEQQSHGIDLRSLLEGNESEEPELPTNATTKEKMAHKLKSPEIKELYKQRKQTVEPVFGIIKECMRFRQFLMRGKEKVGLEWNLVCTAYNLKRFFNLKSSKCSSAVPSCQCQMA